MIDLRGKQWLTMGLKGSGKSNFNKWLLSQRPRHLVFDPMDEYPHPTFNQYIPSHKRGDRAEQELSLVIDNVVNPSRQSLQFFLVDEINRFHSKGGQLDGAIGELLDLNRHYDIGVGGICRRPTQVHTDVRAMADYLFIFRLTAYNDLQMLRNMAVGLDEAVRDLGQYQCVMVKPDRSYQVLDPVPNMDG